MVIISWKYPVVRFVNWHQNLYNLHYIWLYSDTDTCLDKWWFAGCWTPVKGSCHWTFQRWMRWCTCFSRRRQGRSSFWRWSACRSRSSNRWWCWLRRMCRVEKWLRHRCYSTSWWRLQSFFFSYQELVACLLKLQLRNISRIHKSAHEIILIWYVEMFHILMSI